MGERSTTMFEGDEDDMPQGPPATFEVYRAEADDLFRNGKYIKAIQCYSTVSTA